MIEMRMRIGKIFSILSIALSSCRRHPVFMSGFRWIGTTIVSVSPFSPLLEGKIDENDESEMANFR
jgi:hypothetical protein